MIRIAEDALHRIREHGVHSYPEECCGVMLGRDADGSRTIDAVLPIENVQESNRRRRFLISPSQYVEAEKAATERGLELLGFYHSHPDHPAAPSAYDTEHALPWFTYVIVSVREGKADELTAWALRENRERFEQNSVVVSGPTRSAGKKAGGDPASQKGA
jgi:proteasome lid subunit RPN8/RPN11